ncbi:MAG: acyl carrier protein [Ignavibacteriaceae bacterium]
MVSDKLTKLILNELNLKTFDFRDDTVASQVPGWDSYSHINIILAVEEEYNIHFKTDEILKIRKKNIGELQTLIDSKSNN